MCELRYHNASTPTEDFLIAVYKPWGHTTLLGHGAEPPSAQPFCGQQQVGINSGAKIT